MLPYSRQSINKEDIKAIKLALNSRLITQGPLLKKFEEKISKKVNCRYAVGVNSATSGLHIACIALGLKKNDYLWTVSNSYVSSANCGRFCGAKIDFVDIDSETFNICIKSLSKKLLFAKKKKKLPKILVVVHLAGNPSDMIEIKKLSKKYNFKIIEDASHALGSYIKNNPIGNCKFSDLAVFSFHPVKSITTGEGGMVLTNSKKLKYQLEVLRSNGITRDKKTFVQGNFQPWKYEQHVLGYNYRMNEIQAALGISQLNRLKKFIVKRNKTASKYKKLLNKKIIEFQKVEIGNISSYHLMIIKINFKKINKNYNQVFNELRKNRIGVNLHYFPIHLQPYYQKHCGKLRLYNSEAYYKSSFSIPIYYDMKDSEHKLIINKINKIIQ